MDIQTIRKQYEEFLKRWKPPKVADIPPKAVKKKK